MVRRWSLTAHFLILYYPLSPCAAGEPRHVLRVRHSVVRRAGLQRRGHRPAVVRGRVRGDRALRRHLRAQEGEPPTTCQLGRNCNASEGRSRGKHCLHICIQSKPWRSLSNLLQAQLGLLSGGCSGQRACKHAQLRAPRHGTTVFWDHPQLSQRSSTHSHCANTPSCVLRPGHPPLSQRSSTHSHCANTPSCVL
jgi:hypothetical protein